MYLFPNGIGRRQLVEKFGRRINGGLLAEGEVALRLDLENGQEILSIGVEPYVDEQNTTHWAVPRASLTPKLTGMPDAEFDSLL